MLKNTIVRANNIPNFVKQISITVIGLILTGFLLGCAEMDDSAPPPQTSQNMTPKSESSPSGQTDAETPEWIAASEDWPDTMRLAYDSTLETVIDDLLLRLRPTVGQDHSNMNFEGETPLLCDVLMTVRPIPEWELAKGLAIDSVKLHDPVKNRDLQTIPMLAFQRAYEDQTVRTQFLTNMAEQYRQSPELTEGQALNPTIYLSWDGRLIVVTMPAVSLAFKRTP